MSLRATIEGVIVGAVLCAALWYETDHIAEHANNALRAEIQSGLLTIARAVAPVLDADEHRALRGEDRARRAQLETLLRRIRDANPDITFIYTVKEESGGLRFVLDAEDPPARRDEPDNTVDFGEEYEDAPFELRLALQSRQPAVTDRPYTDQWGSFMTAYAPLVERDGAVSAVLGIDVRADDYYKKFEPMKDTIVQARWLTVVMSLFAGCFVFTVRSAAESIAARRDELFEILRAQRSGQ